MTFCFRVYTKCLNCHCNCWLGGRKGIWHVKPCHLFPKGSVLDQVEEEDQGETGWRTAIEAGMAAVVFLAVLVLLVVF